jgi:hypothetical protein
MRDATKVQNHVNRWMNWCLQNPRTVHRIGVDNLIKTLRQRIASGGDEVAISRWEYRRRNQYQLEKFANARTDIEALIQEVRDAYSGSKLEWYATGRLGRAEGAAELLQRMEHDVEIVKLPDGKRHRNRRYVVIER